MPSSSSLSIRIKQLVLGCFSTCISASIALEAYAEVKSLSSSELTETYIEDSTIIITPKQAPLTQQKTVTSVKVSPGDNKQQDYIQLESSDIHQESGSTAFELDDDLLRNAAIESAINPIPQLDIPSYEERTTVPVADILNDERYRAPEGDFDFDYIGADTGVQLTDLGLSRTADKLTFSIGNLPGIEQINLPHGVNEGPVDIVPRPGGGFDLTIDIPQDQ